MKTTELFKKTIKDYLDQRAQQDELFRPVYEKPGKNLDECVSYIIDKVKKSGRCGFSDEEIYSLAVHYYDEDDINANPHPENVHIVVNRSIVLSEEEKEEARNTAIAEYQRKEIEKYRELQNKRKQKSAKPAQEQTSLFGSLF